LDDEDDEVEVGYDEFKVISTETILRASSLAEEDVDE